MSVNFSHAVYSVLDFLTLENGNDKSSQYVSTELSLLCNISEEWRYHDDLAMHALVCFRTVQFQVIQLGTVWFGASYVKLR